MLVQISLLGSVVSKANYQYQGSKLRLLFLEAKSSSFVRTICKH